MNTKSQVHILVGCLNLNIIHQPNVEREEFYSPLPLSRVPEQENKVVCFDQNLTITQRLEIS